jgi:histidine ammonia-lyase
MCSSDLGPVLDTLEYTEEVLENEINSANDNPIINVEDQHVYHGGNFHGDYLLKWISLKLLLPN